MARVELDRPETLAGKAVLGWWEPGDLGRGLPLGMGQCWAPWRSVPELGSFPTPGEKFRVAVQLVEGSRYLVE